MNPYLLYPQSAVPQFSQTMAPIQQMTQFQTVGVPMQFAPTEQFAQVASLQQYPILQQFQSLPQFPTVQQPMTSVQYVPVPVVQSFASMQPYDNKVASVKECSPEEVLAPPKDLALAKNRKRMADENVERREHRQNGVPNRKFNYQHRRPQRKRAKRSEKKVRSEYNHLQKRMEKLENELGRYSTNNTRVETSDQSKRTHSSNTTVEAAAEHPSVTE